MNKIVSLIKYRIIRSDPCYNEYIKKDNNTRSRIDDYLLELYGIDCVNHKDEWEYNYKVVDDSKFALFLLKYPECIEKISYE